MTTGIYKITNKDNGKVYIGQSQNCERRISEHKQERTIPIDMWINMIGKDHFIYEIIECPLEELDKKEQEYIEKYNSREEGYNKQVGGFNNSIGEGNGRAKLSEQDVKEIRLAYNKHLKPKEVYENYKDKISFSSFQSVWQGRSWSHIMPEVYTEENKKYYTSGISKVEISLSLEDLLEYRKYYIDHTYKEVYQYYLNKIKDTDETKVTDTTFRKILTGDVRPNSIYLSVPLYKKSQKQWFLNGEPVSTISVSGE